VTNDIPLSPEDVTEIVAILDGSPYQVLDIKTSRFRLRVARDGDGWSQEWDYSEETSETKAPVVASISSLDDARDIRAALPGTFYRAPAPGAPPFVEVGTSVEPDTVVGIIETMKLMNPVYAGARGIIGDILVENGTMIAKHAALMRLA
jgi:acetyl-CoA carboxylase biotin carboxyl carrier protein